MCFMISAKPNFTSGFLVLLEIYALPNYALVGLTNVREKTEKKSSYIVAAAILKQYC